MLVHIILKYLFWNNLHINVKRTMKFKSGNSRAYYKIYHVGIFILDINPSEIQKIGSSPVTRMRDPVSQMGDPVTRMGDPFS